MRVLLRLLFGILQYDTTSAVTHCSGRHGSEMSSTNHILTRHNPFILNMEISSITTGNTKFCVMWHANDTKFAEVQPVSWWILTVQSGGWRRC